jgi:hypothetical protein
MQITKVGTGSAKAIIYECKEGWNLRMYSASKNKFTFMWACIEKLARGNIIRVDNWVQD